MDGSDDPAWTAAPANLITHLNSDSKDLLRGLSSAWKGLWNSQNLFLQVDVTDPVLVKANPKLAWYEGDGVEVYLDANNSKTEDYDGINDFQIAFPWGAEKPSFGQNSAKIESGFVYNMAPIPGGYRLNLALPWKLTLGFTPTPGALIGLDVHVNDNDDGIHWKGKRAWHATSNDLWMHPNKFGTVELVAADK